jgi:hypothetical protein
LAALPASAAAALEHLNVSGCTRLTTLPEQLTRLVDLDISGCSSLTSLPDGIRVRSRIELAGTALTGLPWSLRSTRLLWRGIPVSDRVAFDPQGLTAADVLYEENQELRRLMLQRMGLARFVEESRAPPTTSRSWKPDRTHGLRSSRVDLLSVADAGLASDGSC